MRFIRNSQKELRADTYKGLADALDQNDFNNAGKKVILPATFVGGPRYMSKKYQDAMAVVRKKGKPDLFAIETHPRLDEIQAICKLFQTEFPD